MESPTLATVLRYARLRSGLSARRVSELAGLSPSYVQKLEDGVIMDPGLKAFARISTVLGMNAHEIQLCVSLAGWGG